LSEGQSYNNQTLEKVKAKLETFASSKLVRIDFILIHMYNVQAYI
jgi:hypothetical protein